LDKGNILSRRFDLFLEGYWSWFRGLGILHLNNLYEDKRFVGFLSSGEVLALACNLHPVFLCIVDLLVLVVV